MPPEPLPIYTLPSVLSTWIFSLREAEAELAHQTEVRRTSGTTNFLRYTLAQILHWLSTCYRRIGANHTGMCMQWNPHTIQFCCPITAAVCLVAYWQPYEAV